MHSCSPATLAIEGSQTDQAGKGALVASALFTLPDLSPLSTTEHNIMSKITVSLGRHGVEPTASGMSIKVPYSPSCSCSNLFHILLRRP